MPTDYIFTGKILSEDIKNDLLNLKHIALSWEYWNRYSFGYSWSDGRILRKNLRIYEGLQRVTLVDDVKLRTDEIFEGHYEIEDPMFEKRAGGSDAKGSQKHEAPSGATAWDQWARRHPELKDHPSAGTVLRSFELGSILEYAKPREQPKASGPKANDPKARFVQIKKVLDSPLRAKEWKVKYVWEDGDDGEPALVWRVPHGQVGRTRGSRGRAFRFQRQ